MKPLLDVLVILDALEKEGSFAAASANAPTPGRISPSAPAITSGSRVMTASAPNRASARSTLRRLPAP